MTQADPGAQAEGAPQSASLRYAVWDAVLVGLSLALGLALLRFPSAPMFAIALWWNANTIAHNFIHRPFFRFLPSDYWNRAYSLYLSALLGFPQSWWRDRHLAHHAGAPFHPRFSGQLVVESAFVTGIWATLLARPDNFFLTVYLPGILAGLGLCWLHGYFEHAGGTVSHYGAVYNALFLNDGYHVEHHRNPDTHWTELAGSRASGGRVSNWPAVLRWMELADCRAIDGLERLALQSTTLQGFLLRKHEVALRQLLPHFQGARAIQIVGGGMFPRTAILLSRLLPDAVITIVEGNARSIAAAQPYLPDGTAIDHRTFSGASEDGADLIVIPLSFRGDRRALYRNPPASLVLVHDWIWAPRGESVVVSRRLLKRLNLVRRQNA